MTPEELKAAAVVGSIWEEANLRPTTKLKLLSVDGDVATYEVVGHPEIPTGSIDTGFLTSGLWVPQET